MTIDEFIAQISKRDLPRNPMARIETFARELAEGAANGLWNTQFNAFAIYNEGRRSNTPAAQVLYRFIEARWGGLETMPKLDLLVQNGFLLYENPQHYELLYTIAKPAFDLLTATDTASIFISYKRSESSSFALLVSHILRHAGLNPFVDMQLEAGHDWRQQLQQNIEAADYLVLLLAPTTLQSAVTLQEIEWAVKAGTTIVPIWHRGFSFRADEWPDVPDDVRELLGATHTIRVTEENPLAYNSALSELLNRFGLSA